MSGGGRQSPEPALSLNSMGACGLGESRCLRVPPGHGAAASPCIFVRRCGLLSPARVSGPRADLAEHTCAPLERAAILHLFYKQDNSLCSRSSGGRAGKRAGSVLCSLSEDKHPTGLSGAALG